MGKKISKSKISNATKKTADITKHVLVPKHRILSDKEAKSLLEKYNISIHQLPLLRIKDPIEQVINAKAGDIVEITRSGPTQDYLFFRRVIE